MGYWGGGGAQGPLGGVREPMEGCWDSKGRTETLWKGVRHPSEE